MSLFGLTLSTVTRGDSSKKLKDVLSPTNLRVAIQTTEGTVLETDLDPSTTPPLDTRAEFRLATDLRSAKETNHDLSTQVSVRNVLCVFSLF